MSEFCEINYDDIIEKNAVGIIGIGGAGCNIVDLFAEKYTKNNCCIAIDSDLSSLKFRENIQTKIQIGKAVCKGLGCVTTDRGSAAVIESKAKIEKILKGYKKIIVVAALSRGCGGGATPEILKWAKELNIQTTVIALLMRTKCPINRNEQKTGIKIDLDLFNLIIEENTISVLKYIKPLVDNIIEIDDIKVLQGEGLIGYFKRIDNIAYNKILQELY